MNTAFRIFTPGDAGQPTVTVADVVKIFLEEKTLRLRSGAYSQERYNKTEFYLESFCCQVGKLTIADCRNHDITRWLLVHEEWISPHTKNDAVGAVIGCFRWAESERHIDRNPYRRPRGLWDTPRPREAIEPDEVRKILNLAREHSGKRGKRKNPSSKAFRNAVWFLWETGCRTCEMRELLWDEIDWGAGVARLTKHKTDRTGEDRVIPLTDRALRLLRWLAKGRSRSRRGNKGGLEGVVFPNGRGRPWTRRTFGRMFRKYADKAGVRSCVSAYCLRHGFCVGALDNGLGERQIADIMGQASTKYVSWYGRSTRKKADYLRKMAEKARGKKKKGGSAETE